MDEQLVASVDVRIVGQINADIGIDSPEIKKALELLPSEFTPTESKTCIFDDYTLPLVTGEAALTFRDMKATFVIAKDTSGVEVCYQTLVFTIQVHMWFIGPPGSAPFHFFLYTLNSAGGNLDTWDVVMNERLNCRLPATPKHYERTFQPNIYRLIDGAAREIPSNIFTHCDKGIAIA
jgi:hypothetical protein